MTPVTKEPGTDRGPARPRRPAGTVVTADLLMLEYWFAGQFGRVWQRVRRHGRSNQDILDACQVVAHGGTVPARKLWAVQAYAARMWFGAALASALIAVGFLVVLLNIPLISIAQMGMVSYRRNQTSRYVLRGGAMVGTKPSEAVRGLSRSSDFWVILAVTIVGSALIFYATAHAHS